MSQSGLGLGRVFNTVPDAKGIHIKMGNAAAVTFTAYNSTDGNISLTLKESKGTGVSEQNLAVIDKIYRCHANNTTGWTEISQAAATTYAGTDGTLKAAQICVRAREMTPGWTHLELDCGANTTIHATVHDLAHQADPTKLVDIV